ncbi:hypothetical protein BKA70DRAFT_1171795, partial [Coprinopsis sp. MPI-PUGE-AT-0042]
SEQWIVDRVTLRQGKVQDLQYVDDPQYLGFLSVKASSILFSQRFYPKCSLCSTDPALLISAYLYVAARAEEFLAHIKNIAVKVENHVHPA